MSKIERYKIFYPHHAFGDNLISVFFTATLSDNGFNAVLYNPDIAHLADCKVTDNSGTGGWLTFDCLRKFRTGLDTDKKYNIITDLAEVFSEKFNISRKINIIRNYIPVKFREYDNVPAYSVVMVSETGYWTSYRNWPYFKELKELLKLSKIDFLDLSENRIRNQEFLNYVNKAKVFLSLETGASHYASKFAGGKTIIIQSGYCDFNYWAGLYDYDHIRHDVKCSPCWLRKGCSWDHKCMKSIKPEFVFKKILKKLRA
jgi:hypothetical protein